MLDRRAQIIDGLKNLITLQRHVDFQRLAIQLAKSKWPEVEATAERRDGGEDGTQFFTGVDGKKRAVACSLTGTLVKVQQDAQRIRERGVALDALVFMTPVALDHLTVSDWRQTIQEEFNHDLHVIPQAEVTTLLEQPAHDWLCRERLGLPAREPLLDELLDQVCQASARLLTGWKQEENYTALPRVPLNLWDPASNTPTTAPDVRQALLARRRILLTGVPGAGKTFTVIQLAEELSRDSAAPTPLLLSLPAWAAANVDLPTYVAQQLAPEGLDAAKVHRLLGAGALVLLLNGWNEITEHGAATQAHVRLQEFARSHPETPLLVATRTSRLAPPLTNPLKVEVSALTYTQKVALVREAGLPQPHLLIEQLSGDPVLTELTDTPLFLAAILQLTRAGRTLPRTHQGILEAFIEQLETQPAHTAALTGPPCDGAARAYLAGLARELMAAGAVICSESEARQIISRCATRLAHSGQPVPVASILLDALVNHHVLVRSAVTGGTIRFSHQQFQEWFAAEALYEEVRTLHATPSAAAVREFQIQVLNRPHWAEALHFLLERMGTGDTRTCQQGATVVRWCLPIDPIFAYALAGSGGPGVWAVVRAELGPLLRGWHAQPVELNRSLARTAIFASKSPDFSDLLWPVIEDRDDQRFLGAIRAGYPFHFACLGPDWRVRFARLPFASRSLLAREAARQDPATIPLLADLAQSDPSVEVRHECLVEVRYRAGSARVGELLRASEAVPWDQDLYRSILDQLPLRELSLLAPRIKRALHESRSPDFSANLLELLERSHDTEWLNCAKASLRPDWPPTLVPMLWSKIHHADAAWAEAWWAEHRAGQSRPDQPPPVNDSYADLMAAFLKAPREDPAHRILHQLPLPVLAREVLREAAQRTDPNELFLLAKLLPGSPGRAQQYRSELDNRTREQLRSLILRIDGLLESEHEFTAYRRADLASILGCVGRAEDTSILETWIERDQEDQRQAKNSPLGSVRRSRACTTYANIYAGAVASLPGSAADQLLVRLLDNAETMGDAADLLAWRLQGPREDEGRSPRTGVLVARQQWIAQIRSPAETALAEQVLRALQRQWPDATAAPPRISPFSLERALGTLVRLRELRILPYLLRPGHTSASLLCQLATQGASIPGREMDAALEKQLAAKFDLPERDLSKLFWSIRDALAALLLSDTPDLGVARIRALPADWFGSHLIDDLIALLAECPASSALDFLIDLAHSHGRQERAVYALTQAFLRHPDPRAHGALFILFDHALRGANSGTYHLVRTLAGVIRRQPQLLHEVEERCPPHASPGQARLLADLLREVGSLPAAMLYLRLLPAAAAYTSTLEEDAEAFCLAKVPLSADGNTYTMTSVEVSVWRAALWQIVQTDPARAPIARALLQHIHHRRMEYGWPAGETRHPDPGFAADSPNWLIPLT